MYYSLERILDLLEKPSTRVVYFWAKPAKIIASFPPNDTLANLLKTKAAIGSAYQPLYEVTLADGSSFVVWFKNGVHIGLGVLNRI